MKNGAPDSVIVLAIRAISGEVTRNMRMIAFGYDGKSAAFRFYVADQPTPKEIEIGEVIAVNFDSGIPIQLDKLDVEFVVSNEPFGKLDSLDFVLYRRSEEV